MTRTTNARIAGFRCRSRHARPDMSRRRGRGFRHLHTGDTGTALARHGHGSKCTGPRGSARARRVPSEGGHGRRRDVLRSGQHALLLPLLARPDDPRHAGLARRAGIGSACRGASAADRRRPSWLHDATHVFTDARVRTFARTVAAHQGSRHTDDAMPIGGTI